MSSLLDIRSLKFRCICVGVLHIFSIRNLMKETVLIGKENKLVVSFSFLHLYRIISPCHNSFKSTLTLCYFFHGFCPYHSFHWYINSLYYPMSPQCVWNRYILWNRKAKIGRKPIWKYFSIQRSMKMVWYLSVYADSLTYTQHPWSHPSHIHPSRRCRQSLTNTHYHSPRWWSSLCTHYTFFFLPNWTPQIFMAGRHLSPNRLWHYYDLILPKKDNYIKESCRWECVLGTN